MTPAGSEKSGPAQSRSLVSGSCGSELLQVGHIGKANGLKGSVSVVFTTNKVAERTRVGTRLFAADRWLVVAAARPQKDRWVLTFEGITSREDVERLRSLTLWAQPIEDPGALYVHELIGCSLFDVSGKEHGEVVAVVSNPASDLLELDAGQLVPLTFYISHGPGKIVVDVPPGLLDAAADEV